MTVDEFDPIALQALINEAIADVPSLQRSVFRHGDLTVLSVIDEVLNEWMPQAEKALALAELRDRLYANQATTTPQELHSLIANTKTSGKVVQPYWNVKDPEAILVSDVPPYGDAGAIMASALKEAGFSSRHVAWTFWDRTGAKDEDPSKWHPYLYSEIRAWNPKIIVTLGAAATMELLGPIEKLADLRGQLHWVGPWPVIPTYSPLYAEKSGRTNQLVQDLSQAQNFAFGNMRNQ